MPTFTPIPVARQREEAWANGGGTTRVVLREPDGADWRLRISVARVAADGPFSELPATRRTLVPLDAPIELRFVDGRTQRAERMQALRFDGSPAPSGHLPAGPTRDFNLMLRGDAQGELAVSTLAGTRMLPAADAWLLYLHSGRAVVQAGADSGCTLGPGDAVRVAAGAEPSVPIAIAGTGEILLVKLYA